MENQQNKYMDRILLQQRRQQAEAVKKEEEIMQLLEQGNDITTGRALVNEEIVLFKRMDMIKENISMMVPEEFFELAGDAIKELYKEDYQPQYLYSNHDSSIIIVYDVLFSESDEDTFSIIRKELLKNFRKEYNDYSIRFTKEKNGEEKDIHYFIHKQKLPEGVYYSITYLMLVKGFIVMGRITCGGHRLKDWKEVLFQMMKSILIKDR